MNIGITSSKLPPTPCPNCGAKNNSATDVENTGNIPKEGDWTICAKCATILRFDAKLKTVWPHPDDEIPKEVDIIRHKLLEALKHKEIQKNQKVQEQGLV